MQWRVQEAVGNRVHGRVVSYHATEVEAQPRGPWVKY